MKNIFLLFVSMALSLTFYGQNKAQKFRIKPNEPHTNITVNKQVDENGNVIRYDSTYTYYYSTNNLTPEEIDSIMNNFSNQFRIDFSFGTQPFIFNDFFALDSIYCQFYDYHKKMMEMLQKQMEMMQKMMQEMNSQSGINQIPEKTDTKYNDYKNETDI